MALERLGAGYRTLSRFQLAASEAKSGDPDKAVADYDALINIGCAEGYYAVGFAHANPAIEVLAVDTSSPALDMLSKLATLNGLQDRIHIADAHTPAELEGLLIATAGMSPGTVGPSLDVHAGDDVVHHLFTALAVRDGGCRFPGCDLPVSRCEAHHVVPWQHGGTTDPSNLVLLCWRHHHDFAHHPQWQLKLLPDAVVEMVKPDGTVLVSNPPARSNVERFAATRAA